MKDGLRNLIGNAARKVNRTGFSQEPNYTAAFFGKLHDEAVINPLTGKFVNLHTSISNDRGPGSAESVTGVDIGLVFQWVDENGLAYEKAILMQAKNDVATLNSTEKSKLFEQCDKMANISSSFVVMDCPFDGSIPQVFRTKKPDALVEPSICLADYLIDFVFPCTQGDDDRKVVEIAKRADRSVTLTTNTPKPKNILKKRRKNTP
ncbi:hypothetical protein [Pseudomonas sp. BIGb0164]|uniref:hypothetical protein n=1 Tax=Pseudomonas sp. BIGb0164 TaxID=2940605 RepID=UPI0021684CAB|nr:hypothetical protein [Pseudomonas sp. BIGb0164]MCS4246144.1 hypothetical protein [Pseudomonas sp. BIGb0164]